jgi:CPA2 family monovalent cation:H+ antiporter-2
VAGELALLDLGVLFTALAVVGAVATRLGQSVIPLYILSGMTLGPAVAGRLGPYAIEETEFVALGAELGIVFLLLFLGLEFNLERLFANRDRIVRAGTLDLAINFSLGLVLGYALFGALLPAFLVAGIVYISSSAIITKALIDLGWIANDEAEPMLGTLVFEDLIIAVYLVIVSALLIGGDDVGAAVESIGIAIGFILALVLLVHYGTPVFQRLLATNSNEFVVLRTVAVTVLIAGLALELGVSEAVVAFFVGMAFSATDHVEQLERLLEPVRDFFAAVFFFWIGVLTDPLAVAAVGTAIAVAVLVTTPTKLVSGYLGGRIYDLDARRSTRVALGMTTRGEFSLIVAALAVSGAGTTLAPETAEVIYAVTVGYVLAMSVLGTSLMQYSGSIERFVVPLLEAPNSDGVADGR